MTQIQNKIHKILHEMHEHKLAHAVCQHETTARDNRFGKGQYVLYSSRYGATIRRNNSNHSHYKTVKFVMTSSSKTILDKIDN